MNFEIIKMAVESLLANKTRTILSMLGVIIGVSTVIAVVGIGKGAEQSVNEQFEGLSANSIIVISIKAKGATSSSKLETEDSEILLEQGENITIAVANSTVSYGSESSNLTIIGGG